MRKAEGVVVLVIGMTGAAACATAGPSFPAGTREVTIPAAVVRDIRDHWKGASIGEGTYGCSGAGTAAQATPILPADINGDGVEDLVIRAGLEGQSRLFASLARLEDEYDVWPVTPDGQDLPPGTLAIQPKGTPYRLEHLTIDQYLGADTIVLTQCDGVRLAYLWTGHGFVPERLAAPIATPAAASTSPPTGAPPR